MDSTTSANLKALALANRSEGRGANELDIRGALLAAAGSSGFALFNVSDPAHPEEAGLFSSSSGSFDVKFSPDNLTLLVGHIKGVDLVDVRDPENPAKVGEWLFPQPDYQTAHMLYSARIDNQDWVFVAPTGMRGVVVLKLDGPPETRKLTYVTQTLPVEGGLYGPHDMYATYDNTLGKWLLYVADGFQGWLVFDVNNPAQPVPMGGWVAPETGYTHTIQAANINGKRIVATIQEIGVNLLKVYDATALESPVLLGVWQADASSPLQAQHNFQIVQGKLYMAHYGLGFYVFDLTKVTAPLTGTNDLKPVAHVVGYGCNQPGDASVTSVG